MERFVDFASGKTGRTVRIVVGAVLVMAALLYMSDVTKWIVVAIGTLLMLSGVMKICVLNKLVGRKISACPN
jgi:uncharacterized membrane protein HdeD (DUF308 family)